MRAELPVRPAFFLGRALTRSHYLTRSLGVLATAGAVGAFLLLGGVIGRGAERAERTEASPVEVLPVSVEAVRLREGYEVERSFVGRVEPSRSSGLGFELGGRLVAVEVDEGDVVRRGNVVARLDTARLEARRAELVARRAQAGAVLDELVAGPRDEVVAAAVAEVAEMEARLRRAGATGRRIAELHRRSAASAQEFDEARYDEEAAAAALDASRARLDELEAGTRAEQVEAQRASVRQLDAEIASVDLDLAKSALKAPFDGTIAERLIDEGEVIEAGRPVVRLLETGRLEVHVGVAADAVGSVAVGEQRTLQINDRPCEAEVASVRPDRRDRTRAVTVRLVDRRRRPRAADGRPGDAQPGEGGGRAGRLGADPGALGGRPGPLDLLRGGAGRPDG